MRNVDIRHICDVIIYIITSQKKYIYTRAYVIHEMTRGANIYCTSNRNFDSKWETRTAVLP
jgi:hypothetical protein